MSDLWMRLTLAIIAGFTFLSGATGDMTFSQLGGLPAATWMMFIVNALTAFTSPSVIKKVAGVTS